MRKLSSPKSVLVPLLLGLAVIGPSWGAEEDPEEKTYILYTGANLKVMEGEDTFPIVSFNEFSATIDHGGRLVKVPLEKLGRFRIEREMKLNNLTATIRNLKSGKAYTPGREKVADWGTLASGSYSTDKGPLDAVQGNYFEDSVTFQNSSRIDPGLGGGYRGSGEGATLLSEHEQADTPFDALEVILDLESKDSIVDPYLVLVTDFRDPAFPDRNLRKFFVEILEGISHEPVTIRLLQGGFPVGFEVEDINVFLYSKGREVPTNLSDKQIALTRDEAFQYLILEYLVGHKGETLAPKPMWVGMRPEVKELVKGLDVNPELTLALDSKGRVVNLAIGNDDALDSVIIEAFHAFRFYPALESGKAVEGSYALRPKELVR